MDKTSGDEFGQKLAPCEANHEEEGPSGDCTGGRKYHTPPPLLFSFYFAPVSVLSHPTHPARQVTMSEVIVNFDIVANILSFLSVNEKSKARLVCKTWKEAAEYELVKLTVVYTDEPVAINDSGYMMRLLPFMEEEEYSIYQRYSGNQLILKPSNVAFPRPALEFIEKFCPGVVGLVCNVHLVSQWIHSMMPKLKFLQCFSITSVPLSKGAIRRFIPSHISDYHAYWRRNWASNFINVDTNNTNLPALQSLRFNGWRRDFEHLVNRGTPIKASYINLMPVDASRYLPSDIKYIEWRISSSAQHAFYDIDYMNRIRPFTRASLIQLDVSLHGGRCSFDFPNLKRVNITINNDASGSSKLVEGFVESLYHSKHLKYIKLQVFHMESDHLKMMSSVVDGLNELTDLYIFNLSTGRVRWSDEVVTRLVQSIASCRNLVRLHLQFPGSKPEHMAILARLNKLRRLVVEDFSPQLIASFIMNLNVGRYDRLVLLESTVRYHRMSPELHMAIQQVLQYQVLTTLTSHVKCVCNNNNCPLKLLGYQSEWQPQPFRLAVY